MDDYRQSHLNNPADDFIIPRFKQDCMNIHLYSRKYPMTTITFGTLQLVDRLKAVGFQQEQAE